MWVNGAELAVEIEGTGPPWCCCTVGRHGNFYQPQAAALGERFTVVAPTCAARPSPLAGRSALTATWPT